MTGFYMSSQPSPVSKAKKILLPPPYCMKSSRLPKRASHLLRPRPSLVGCIQVESKLEEARRAPHSRFESSRCLAEESDSDAEMQSRRFGQQCILTALQSTRASNNITFYLATRAGGGDGPSLETVGVLMKGRTLRNRAALERPLCKPHMHRKRG